MMRTIAKRAASLVLSVAVFASVAVFLLVAVGPRTGQYRTLTVLSGSMAPTVRPGSVVVAAPAPVTDLAVGDVLVYRIPVEDRRVVTHRIVEIVETGPRPVVRTQGDANNAPDPWLARLEDDVAWKMETSVPLLGHGISLLREPWLSRALVLLCPLLLSLMWLADIWRRPQGATAAHLARSTELDGRRGLWRRLAAGA